MPKGRDTGRGGNRGPTPADVLREQIAAKLKEERARQRVLNASRAAARAQIEAKWIKQSKEPRFLTLRRLAVVAVSLFFIVLFASHLGIHLPSLHASNGDSTTSSGGNGNGGAPAPLPPVSLAGAIPCEYIYKPNINLNTKERVQACWDAKNYAKSLLIQHFGATEGETQFGCQDNLWEGESAWSAWAINLSSGAYGIAQALGHGNVYAMGDWKAQVDWGLAYIYGRYKTPCQAWHTWNARQPHWY